MLLNLLSNALKFTQRDGKILIVTEFQPKAEKNKTLVRPPLNPELNLDYVRISVIDSGLGIKDEDHDRLFKLFGSIKNEKKKINQHGIGLGLVIS